MFGFDRITFDPNILGGKACIRGMRISVSLVINLVANGMSVQEIIDEYPDLQPEDVEAVRIQRVGENLLRHPVHEGVVDVQRFGRVEQRE